MATKKTEKPAEEKKPKCFVIMPFGGWFDKYYTEVYKPAIIEAGFDPQRADDLYRPGNIVNDIWNYTKAADVILADLTSKNPNVFYELGLAHAITKPAVLITASMEDVPFDLRSLRVIEYNQKSPDWGKLLQENIKKALTETLKSPEDAIPPTFFDVSKSKRLEVGETEKEILNLRKRVDTLDSVLRTLIPVTTTTSTINHDDEYREINMQTYKDYANLRDQIKNTNLNSPPPQKNLS